MKPYYEDEWVRLYHGDAMELIPDMAVVPSSECFGVLLTDPPYGIAYKSGQRRDTLADSIVGDEDTELRDYVVSVWGGPMLIFGSWRVPRPAGTRARLIWDTKGALGMGALDLPWKPADQEIYVLGHGFRGHRDNNVIQCAPVQSMARNGRCHPHEKPVDLLIRLLDKCPPGPVFDPFAGSGSTLVAAKRVGRKALGIEIEERYCEIAAARLAQGALDFGEAS